MNDAFIYDKDYSFDYFNWLKVSQDNKLLDKFLSSKTNNPFLDDFQKNIINNNNASMAYFFANEFPYKSYLMQNVVLKSNNAKYIYLFALNINGADIISLEKKIIETKNIKYITKFACFVNKSNRKTLKDIILKSKNIKYCFMYLLHTKENCKNLIDIILKSNKPKYIFDLIKIDRNLSNIVESRLVELNAIRYLRLFAVRVKNCDLERIEKTIISTQNLEEVKKFGLSVKRSKLHVFSVIL